MRRRGTRSAVGGIAALLVALTWAAAASADWRELVGGGAPTAVGSGGAPSLVVTGGVPYVAWSEDGDIRVAKLNATGTAWTVVGGVLDHATGADAGEPSMAVVGGVPHVAWLESDGLDVLVRVAKLNAGGTGWVEIVGGVNPVNHDATKNAYAVSLADVGGVPHVAWSEEVDGNLNKAQVWVDKLSASGTAWEQVGGSNPLNYDPSQQAMNPSVAGIGGVPYVAWQENYGDGDIHAAKLNAGGTGWDQLGGGASPINHDPAEGAGHPSLTGIGGVAHVAWVEEDSDDLEIRASRFDGTNWVEIGAGADPISGGGVSPAFEPSLASIGGVPYVAFSAYDGTYRVRVSKLTGGTSWTDVSGEVNASHGADGIQTSLAASGSAPLVAWAQDGGGALQVRVAAEPTPISFSSTTYTAGEGAGTATITIQRSGGVGRATVQYATADGTAHQPGDYTSASGTLTFNPGETAKTFPVTIVDDNDPDGDKTVQLALSSPDGIGSLAAPVAATLTITDDDTVDTRITSGPSGPTNDSTPTFEFDATKPAPTFTCAFDLAAAAPCTSPFTPSTPLTDGTHTFVVTASAPGAGTDPTPAFRTFVVDTKSPSTTIAITPSPGQGQDLGNGRFAGTIRIGPQPNDPSPSGGISGSRCAVDPPTPPTTYTDMYLPCSVASPLTIAPAAGQHTVYAGSRDLAGNNGPIASTTFTVVAKPNVTITGGPDGFTWFKSSQFTFSSSAPGATFRCRLDSDEFRPCTSPWLSPSKSGGGHTFEVKAVSAEGAESDVARRFFTIEEPQTTRYTCELRPYLGLYFNRQDYGCEISTVVPGSPRGTFCHQNNTLCQGIPDSCPLGARCTITGTGTWRNADPFGAQVSGRVLMRKNPSAQSERLYEALTYCRADAGRSCTASATLERFGEPSVVGMMCYGPERIAQPDESGPDGQRSLTCGGVLKVVPAEALAALSQGGSVSINAPGPGSVVVAPGGGAGKAKSAKAKPSFKAATLAAQGAGPVDFKPKLNKAAKKQLKTKGKVKLSLAISYAPAGAGEATAGSATVKLTARKKPRRR
jgi:hypothetical protein